MRAQGTRPTRGGRTSLVLWAFAFPEAERETGENDDVSYAEVEEAITQQRKAIRFFGGFPHSFCSWFFHADDRLESVPYYTFRIQGMTQLHVTQRGARRPVQLFNNRSLEKLFASYDSVKFFLTRERLREVIVRV